MSTAQLSRSTYEEEVRTMTPNYAQIIQSLQNELALTEDAVKLVAAGVLCLPIILWEYDLLNLDQVDQVCKWLAVAYASHLEGAL